MHSYRKMPKDQLKSALFTTSQQIFTCPCCRGMTYTRVLLKDGYEIARCGQCELQSVASMPTQAQALDTYQDPTYYTGDEKGYHNYLDMAKVLLPLANRRLNWIASHLPPQLSRPRLLDIGCAAGFFLQQAQIRSWDIIGVEVARTMAVTTQQRLGIPVFTSLTELPPEHAALDVITLWEVIEHLVDPQAVLREIHHKLNPQGLLVLSTPNTAHWQAQRYPEQWLAYSPPAHLIFFTSMTLRTMIETAGFEVLKLRRTAPRPQLPVWLETLFAPVQQGLAQGDAARWRFALFAWRTVRVLAMLRDGLRHSPDDTMMTLELIARKIP